MAKGEQRGNREKKKPKKEKPKTIAAAPSMKSLMQSGAEKSNSSGAYREYNASIHDAI